MFAYTLKMFLFSLNTQTCLCGFILHMSACKLHCSSCAALFFKKKNVCKMLAMFYWTHTFECYLKVWHSAASSLCYLSRVLEPHDSIYLFCFWCHFWLLFPRDDVWGGDQCCLGSQPCLWISSSLITISCFHLILTSSNPPQLLRGKWSNTKIWILKLKSQIF